MSRHPSRFRPTWVEISASEFTHNLTQIKRIVGPRVGLLAVLKADAYGHGAVPLARYALKAGVSRLGVSSIEEGLVLREAGVKAPILIMGSLYPLNNLKAAFEYDLTPTIASLEAYAAFKRFSVSRKKKPVFHLKVDTGMGRIGVSPDGAEKILAACATDNPKALAGIYTHLATADSDLSYAVEQKRRLLEVEKSARRFGFNRVPFHIANSAAILRSKEFHLDLVRPGLALYGVSVIQPIKEFRLQPVLSWQTQVVFLKKIPAGASVSYGRTFTASRPSLIATLPVGYADGVPRSLSNKGVVLVQGRRCPIVGRVTMDQIMIDVTGLSINVGESVILIGRIGKSTIHVSEWAAWANTIPYEIFCGISKRVPRVVTE